MINVRNVNIFHKYISTMRLKMNTNFLKVIELELTSMKIF